MRFIIKWIARILLSPIIIPCLLLTLIIAMAIDNYEYWLEYWGFKEVNDE